MASKEVVSEAPNFDSKIANVKKSQQWFGGSTSKTPIADFVMDVPALLYLMRQGESLFKKKSILGYSCIRVP